MTARSDYKVAEPKKHRNRTSQYTVESMLKLLRLAAEFRKGCHAVLGLLDKTCDNMGAIHSAERALFLLGPKLVHPELGHLNTLRDFDGAVFSEKAWVAKQAGQPEIITIEHVAPHRALTKRVISKIEAGLSDDELIAYIKETFRVVLLTKEEAAQLNRLNRSEIEEGRLEKAGIKLREIQSQGPAQQ